MGLDLAAGGHLTHGSPVNLSGKWFKPIPYGVRRDDNRIDMEQVGAVWPRSTSRSLSLRAAPAIPAIGILPRFREIAD